MIPAAVANPLPALKVAIFDDARRPRVETRGLCPRYAVGNGSETM